MKKQLTSKEKEKLVDDHKRRVEAMRARPGFDAYESPKDKQARIKRCLDDPNEFVRTYFPEYATSDLGVFQVRWFKKARKRNKWRVVQRWPRAHAKSVISDMMLPIWLWAQGEPMYLVLIGASLDAAKILLSDVQAQFEGNQKLLHDFGDQEMQGDWTDGRFTTKGGFTGHALGMGQNVRGLRKAALRPTLVVMDDCETKDIVKNEKRQREMVRWITGAVLKTMDGPIQRFIMANNGFAPSMIQHKLLAGDGNWELDEVKAYDKVTYECAWPEKYTPDYWRDMERTDGKLSTWAEMLHEPHIEGAIFTDSLFNVGRPPALNHFVHILGHWDVAYSGTSTADYNAVRVWGLDKDRRFWLLGTYCKQSKMRGAIDWMVDFDRNLPETVIVHWQYESQFWNDALERDIQEACAATKHELLIRKAELVKANKYDRILSMASYFENGRVWFSEKLTGLADHEVGLAQLKGIEPGYSSHDDAPDADERAISHLARYARTTEYPDPVFGTRTTNRGTY